MLQIVLSFLFPSASAEESALPEGFVYVKDLIRDGIEQMRYAGEENFVGAVVDGYLAPRAILTAEAAQALQKAAEAARGLSLSEGKDWGYINDKCLTDLTPENEDGTTPVGIWFKPLPDEIAHEISRKYPLYRD